MSDVEGQLLAVYDPKLIKDLLTELYENRGLNREQIISLNENVSLLKKKRIFFWCLQLELGGYFFKEAFMLVDIFVQI